jgi:hypothetical protein
MSALARSTIQLTSRDMAIVEMIYRFAGCTVEHIHERLWPENTALSSCYRRIAWLVAAKYLAATRLPSLSGQGSGRTLLTIGPASRPLVAKLLGVPVTSLPRSTDIATPLFLAHHFAVCDFRVALELATADDPTVDLVDWTLETELKRSPTRVTDTYSLQGKSRIRTITLIPDGAFTLAHHGSTERAYLEQDMATMSPKRLALKLRGYLTQQHELPVPVFFVTLTKSRAAQIIDLAAREADQLRADPTVFFVTTKDRIRKDTILHAPIWHQPTVQPLVAIIRGSAPDDTASPVPFNGTRSTSPPVRLGHR